MILKGNQRGGAKALALHLLNTTDNDHVEVHSINGFIATDVEGALQEIQAISRATNCKQFMFSQSLSPPQDAIVSDQDFLDAIHQSMDKLGLAGQPHMIIFHEKNGRRHCHFVASRIDATEMKAINLPFYKERLCELSRQLYLTHGWDMPKGHEDRLQSDPLNYSLEEYQVAQRAKRDPKTIKAILQDCWAQSDNKSSFEASQQEHGFVLCRGDRRGFVALDAQGNVYSLSRWLGVKTKELKIRLGDPSLLPSIEEQEAAFDTPVPLSQQNSLVAYEAKLAGLLRQKERLKSGQRDERLCLKQNHNQEKSTRIKELQRTSSGLTGLWNWLNGNRDNLIAQNRVILDDLDKQYQTRALTLSKQHRDNRSLLQRNIDAMQKWRDVELGRPATNNPFHQPTKTPAEKLEERLIAESVQKNPVHILDVIADKKGVFSKNDILHRLADYITDPDAYQSAKAQVFASDHLVILDDSANPKYSTREFVTLEKRMVDLAKSMADQKAYGVSLNNLKLAIRHQDKALQKSVGANLSEEQHRAITHVVNRRQLSAVIGLAGAGKSTMLSAAREAWERQGYRVIGGALAGKAADGLQSASGIPSRTLASYEYSWKHGRNLLQPGDVLVIDEAGMIGSRQMTRFIAEAQSRRAKIVLVGDPDQLQPINAGTPFRDITSKIGYAELNEIRRQKSEWQRKASYDLAKGNVAEALTAYDEHGAVHVEKTHGDAIAALVEDYMADWELNGAEKSRLALAHRRVDVHAINEGIRAARKSAGELSDERIYQTDSGQRTFAVGDRILFTKNDTELGVKNGTLGTVETVTAGKLTVLVDSSDALHNSRNISVQLIRKSALEYGYASTIHKSQGATVDNCFVLNSRSMDNHLKYVALTRHKSILSIHMHGNSRDQNAKNNTFDYAGTRSPPSNSDFCKELELQC